jgi:tetratricopeptide (TPR) repeat protein
MRALLPSLLVVPLAALAAPPVATDVARDEVVATQLLPRALKAAVARVPADAGARLTAARRLIEAGRASGDPRALGYAEAQLAAWPADDDRSPAEALLLHATIAQARHDFARARAMLARVLERTAPQSAAHLQALLTRATVALVAGDYRAARDDCARLRAGALDAGVVCTAAVDAASGRLDAAIAALRVAVQRTDGGLRAWALSLLAQCYEQRGERAQADAAYRAALAAGDDLVTRLAYADFLLAQGALDAARAVLADLPAADGVLLRRWRVARSAAENATALETALAARLREAQRRADGSALLHARDWAAFELERGNAAAALQLARSNWDAQREIEDLLLLTRAAAASGDRAALAKVRAWIEKTGLQDVRLAALLAGAPR